MRLQWLINPSILLIVVCAVHSCGEVDAPGMEPGKAPQYTLSAPEGWGTERIPFPIQFAPQISYKGFEDLRFAPGWEFTTSEEHWSYVFLWWIDGEINLDTTLLNHLGDYYYGLLSLNVGERNIPATKVVRPTTTINKMATANGDVQTFRGTINMVDYLDVTYPLITLNVTIHRRSCDQHTAVLFKVSPQPVASKVWQQLDQVVASFNCTTR